MDNRVPDHEASWHDRYDTAYDDCWALGEDAAWAHLHALQQATYRQVFEREQQAGVDAPTAHAGASAASQTIRAQIEAEWQTQEQEAQAVLDETNARHWRLWYGRDDEDETIALDLPAV